MILGFKTFIKNNLGIILLNILAFSVYFYIGLKFNYISNVNNYMFMSPDSRSYLGVSDYIYGKAISASIEKRTYLYPLLLGIRNIFGNTSIWVLQMFFYFLSLNFLSKSIYIFTNKKWLFYFSYLLFLSNVSPLVLTYFGLTEVTVIFLTCIFIYLLVKYDFKINSRLTFPLLLILSFLTVTRPNYQLHFLLFAAVLIGYYILKKEKLSKLLVVVFLASIPIFIQMGMVYKQTGRFEISNISQVTFEEYYFSKVYSNVQHVSLVEARSTTDRFTDKQRYVFLSKVPFESFNTYFDNVIVHNILAPTPYHMGSSVLEKYSVVYNKLLLIVHGLGLLFYIPFVFCGNVSKKSKFIVTTMLVFSYFVIIPSGLSFNQGDRLVASALPFWLFAYSFILGTGVSGLKKHGFLFLRRLNATQRNIHTILLVLI
jgi:hypothetical protein